MSARKKFQGAQIPIVLTILLVVGTAWSWVAEKNRLESADQVQSKLANFALEGADDGWEMSGPACCMTLEQADKAEAALIASKQKASCPGCPSSEVSMAAADKDMPACCSGKTATTASSEKSLADCCEKDSTMAAAAEKEVPSCCAAGSTTASAPDKDVEGIIAAVKIPQVEDQN